MNVDTAQSRIPCQGLWRQLREDVACVFERDPAARNTFEVLTTYPGVHAVLMHRLAARLWRGGWRYGARLLAYIARSVTQIEIHPGAQIGARFFIDHGCGIVIGETAEIGDDVTLYHGVTLGGTTWRRGKRHPTLGSNVVVGAGAKVLGPIVVGDGARIGANSVVVKSVPPGRTAVGIPSKVVMMNRAPTPVEGQRPPAGIDLDHHLIPDPVASAISCLIDRIRELEQRAGVERAPGRSVAPPPLEDECSDCRAVQLCAGETETA